MAALGQSAAPPRKLRALVAESVQNEVKAAEDENTLVTYKLRKDSTSGVALRVILETKEGILARTIGWNGRTLTAEEQAKEDARLQRLVSDADERQKKFRDQRAEEDRVIRMLRALPDGLLYTDDGVETIRGRNTIRLAFRPNPDFDPPTRDTSVLKAAVGKLWIDEKAHRVVKLDGTLNDDVYIGWGLLGHIHPGGHVLLEQQVVDGGVWRITTLNLDATGSALIFKTLNIKQHQSSFEFRLVRSMDTSEAVKFLLQQSDGGEVKAAGK